MAVKARTEDPAYESVLQFLSANLEICEPSSPLSQSHSRGAPSNYDTSRSDAKSHNLTAKAATTTVLAFSIEKIGQAKASNIALQN